MTARIAVLASGGGTNLQAILDHFDRLGDARAGDVTLVVSNRADAGALERARSRGIATGVIESDGNGLLEMLVEQSIDLVALAGYLRLIPPMVTSAYRGRLVNVHPGPLPAFGGPGMYGRHVHRAVLDAGAAFSAVTVHFVDERYDHGATIAQWPVDVQPGDTPDTLAARVLAVEHLIYPRILDALAATYTASVSVS